MGRKLTIIGAGAILLGAGLATLGPGLFLQGWLAAAVLLLVSFYLLFFAWRWAGGGRGLAWQTGLAFALRLAIGVGLWLALPHLGFSDSAVNQAGYSYLDAYSRDGQAWNLAISGQPLWAAFTSQFSTDQYGGLLSLSALIYRVLSPDAQRPWLILIVTAFFAALGVPFLRKALADKFGDKVTNLAVWIFALYPESLLLGGSQMREPILIGLTAIGLWTVGEWRRLRWKSLALVGVVGVVMLTFSWLVAVPMLAVLFVWWWIDFSAQLESRRLRWAGWSAIGLFGLIALAGIGAWLSELAHWDALLSYRNSGMIQAVFNAMPDFLERPFLLIYGLLQPVLPAAIFDPSVPIWTGISTFRALGWYAVLPLLIFIPFVLSSAEPGVKRRWLIWSFVFFAGWALLSSFRAGGDEWDNPRYRTLAMPWMALLVAWGWVEARQAASAWLKRLYLCEGIFLVLFSGWYINRSFALKLPISFWDVIGGGVVLCGLVLVVGWLSDTLRAQRSSPGQIPRVDPKTILASLRLIFAIFGLVSLASLFLKLAYLGKTKDWFEFVRYYHHILPAMGILLSLVGLALTYVSEGAAIAAVTGRLLDWLHRHRLAGLGLMLVAAVPLPFLELEDAIVKIRPYLPDLWIFGLSVLLGAFVIWSLRPAKGIQRGLVLALLLYGVAFLAAMQLPRITNYPFSLNWSEGSRIYEASQVYAPLVYGYSLPLPLLDVGRAILQGLPFLIPNLTLAVHRAWLVFLELGFALATVMLIARRMHIRRRGDRLIFVLLGLLFFYQGPIFPHLLLVTWLVLWRFDPKKPWQALIWVGLSSLWAGLTRINWFPVAGSLAALLYFLETPINGKKWINYLLAPAAYVLAGTAIAFGVYYGYIHLSGNPLSEFGTSLSSTMIWARLWPNPSFGLGILPGILLAVLPGTALVLARLARGRGSWNGLRLAGVTALLLVFLAGGVIVSLKIGGGNNLHNLDAFLMLFLVAGASVLLDRFAPDRPGQMAALNWSPVWLALLVMIPVGFTLATQDAPALPSAKETQASLAYLQRAITRANSRNESILFMSERQLIAFHLVPPVKVEPPYERVVIAEMAMADDRSYLDQYDADLASHRYGMIIVEPLRIVYLDETKENFAQENNRFVKDIFSPLSQYYVTDRVLREVNVSVMVPPRN